MSWKHVFDCKKLYEYRDHIAKAANLAGYKFFLYDGNVYFVDKRYTYHETGLRVEDLV